MAEAIVVRRGIVVPAEAIRVRAVRSSGPGGQNVNKVSSKVELRVDVSRTMGVDEGVLARLKAIAGGAMGEDGWLRVTSQRTRDQRVNLADARDKLRALLLRALEKPKPRRKTTPTRSSVERRMEEKRRRAKVKAQRRG